MLKRKKLFNVKGNRGTDSLFGGNSTNLREWNRIKYDWTSTIYRTMLNNFWIPEEISLHDDIKQYENLTEEEIFAFERILSFLNFLDSIQSENISNIAKYSTAPEVTALLNIQTFQEEVHAQSYSYILDTITSPENRDRIYDMWRDDELLKERIQFISNIYQELLDEPNDRNLIRVLMANYILEGIYFYSGFAFFYTLARRGAISGITSIFKYINRDETTHLVIFQNMMKTIALEDNELFDEIKDELTDLMKQGVEWEIKWGQYVTNNKILGLSNELIDQYIKYLSNLRMKSIGLTPLYPEITQDPIPWIHKFSEVNDTKTDFFEAKVINYTKASNFDINSLK